MMVKNRQRRARHSKRTDQHKRQRHANKGSHTTTLRCQPRSFFIYSNNVDDDMIELLLSYLEI